MPTPKAPRAYTRCHGCGTKYPAARTTPRCSSCRDGQEYLWPLPSAPTGFVPIPQERA